MLDFELVVVVVGKAIVEILDGEEIVREEDVAITDDDESILVVDERAAEGVDVENVLGVVDEEAAVVDDEAEISIL